MTTKEDQHDPSGEQAAWRAESAGQTIRLRERTKQVGKSKRESLKALETRLTERLQALSEELAREQAASAERETALAARAESLDEQAAELALLKDDLQSRRAEWERAQAQAGARHQKLLEELHGEQRELVRHGAEVKEQTSRLTQRKAELDRQEAEIRQKELASAKREAELAAITRRQAATRDQRRRLARELRAQRTHMLAEVEQRRAEILQVSVGEESQLHRELIEQKAECGRLRDELAHRERQREELAVQLREAQAMPVGDPEALAELDDLRSQCQRLKERLSDSQQRCEDAERRLEERPAGGTADNEQLDELRRRFEMAVQDVRDLKNQNVELKRELEAARRRPGPSPAASAPVDGGDWESQKKRLMQQLEEDFDTRKPEGSEGKLTVEEAIRVTDQMVVEKDREIQELQRLLNDQSSNIGGLAVGATAIAAVLDQDELIREERESLKRIQDEWREKLRQAEVDISLERAKLARERTELEEKLRHLEANSKDEVAGIEAGSDRSKKPRRWLSLLMKEGEGK